MNLINKIPKSSGLARKVPCNGCTICCYNTIIDMRPEYGDDASLYETEELVHPLTGKTVVALKHRPDRGCIYLGERGCTIHDRLPAICKEFSCIEAYKETDRVTRKRLTALGTVNKRIYDRGRELWLEEVKNG